MKTNETVDTILAVDRALIILKTLAESRDEIGVRDISRELGYSPAVTQKILNTLKAHEFVQQNMDTQRYRLGLGALHIGLAMLSQTSLLKVARPYMDSLTAGTGETTFLAIRDENQAVYIDLVKSPHPIRMDAELGARRPLNCTSVGKALLAWAPSGSTTQAVKSGAFEKLTKNSIVDVETLEAELTNVKKQGYALDDEEYNAEAMCVAAPIFGRDGQIIAAITTSGPSSRMRDKIPEIAEMVKKNAAGISAKLGYGLNASTEFNQGEAL